MLDISLGRDAARELARGAEDEDDDDEGDEGDGRLCARGGDVRIRDGMFPEPARADDGTRGCESDSWRRRLLET